MQHKESTLLASGRGASNTGSMVSRSLFLITTSYTLWMQINDVNNGPGRNHSQIHTSIFNSFSKLRASKDFYTSLGEENEVSRFIICTFIVVFKHVWNCLKAAVYDYWWNFNEEMFSLMIWRCMGNVHSTSETKCKWFSGQFVLTQGTEGWISYNPLLRALCFNLGTTQRTGLQNFRLIHSVKACEWMKIDKVERTQRWHEPGRVFRSRGRKRK